MWWWKLTSSLLTWYRFQMWRCLAKTSKKLASVGSVDRDEVVLVAGPVVEPVAVILSRFFIIDEIV
jgi:hypothetical protein